MHRRKSRNNPLILFSDEINCTSISRLSFLFKTHVKTCWNQTVAACTLWIMLNSILKMKNNTPSLRAGNWSDLNQAAANPRRTVTRNGAWAVNQSSRGFTAQLSESWAYLSPYSAEQKKKKKNTHSCLFISSLFLYPPHPPPPPRSLSSVMNGRYEFSLASRGLSLRPSAAEQTTHSQT